MGVRDIAFNNDGSRFLSAGFDKMVRLWDTETGACISRFTNKKIPYCVKFHPAEDKQHLFVSGTQDRKVLCYDVRSGEVVQEYEEPPLLVYSDACVNIVLFCSTLFSMIREHLSFPCLCMAVVNIV